MYALIDSNNFFVSCERLFRPDLAHVPVVVLSSNDGCAISRSAEAKALGVRMGEPIFKLRERFHVLESRVMSQESRRENGGPVACHSERSRGISSSYIANETLRQAQGGRAHNLVVFSANFELYGDISERIATTLTSMTPHIELYSIDEAFLDISELDIADYEAWGRAVRDHIARTIGIPVSIGIAPTKTLCKLTNHWAKEHPKTHGVFVLDSRVMSQESRNTATPLHDKNSWLPNRVRDNTEKTANSLRCHSRAGGNPVNQPSQSDTTSTLDSWRTTLTSVGIADVWGVGRKLTPRLKAEGVHTALDLARLRPQRAQQLMGIHGRHMVYELNGTRCLPLQPHTKPQHMIARGRQFGQDTSDFTVVEAAVTTMASRAAAELRREGQLATRAVVILQTNRRKPGYTRTFDPVRFYTPTADTGTICSQLIRTLQHTFRAHLSYHKADVLLYDLTPAHHLQTDVFGSVDLATHARNQARMRALDAVTAKHGPHALRPAAELLSDAWKPRSAMHSPRYTSAWPDLPEVHTR